MLEDVPTNYPLRSKLLGVNMDHERDLEVIKDYLLDQAETIPAKVIKIYEDKLISLRMLLISAVEKGKITIDPSGAYRYGNLFLGMAEESAVEWMNNNENKSSVEMLEREVNPAYFKATESKKPKAELHRE